MKNKDAWKSNDEIRSSLRMALYEAMHEDNTMTYAKLAEEFEIKPNEAKKLVVEHCRTFNLQEPITFISYDFRKKKPFVENIGKLITYKDQEAEIVVEHENTFIIQLPNYQRVVLPKKELMI